MASLATAARLSARVAGRRIPAESTARGFRTSARCLAAQNFSMPALSPTMTEGSIASWKVKEGESFSAGDVLLEIETDKATMDVEAQDDGVMFKITTGDGAKAVQVGTRIAVIAEPGDDLSSLEVPAEDNTSSSKPAPAAEKSAPKSDGPAAASAPAQQKGGAAKTSGSKAREQRYPLLPSVQALVNGHGLDKDAVNQIEPTGPNGRLLKGDVLAYLGTINAETPSKIMDRAVKMSHLDLSNIKVAPKKEAPAPKKAEAAAAAPAAPVDSEVALPVSLAKVLEAQKRIQSTLGVFMPVSTFVARAAEVANDDLPPSARKATADELFNQVLGLDKLAPRGSRGYYLPQISALPESSLLAPRASKRSSSADIIDFLAAPAKKTVPAKKSVAAHHTPGMSSGSNLFTVTVPQGDEKRAKVFLERVKVILEEEPGRLVL
ncbi:biotin-requiring enzyme [Colletotrichum scovillei]|uniref:Pyruvate dehydrogenase e2 component (Dihydrolipoamide acetyltransferase) n=1 Tax=Colletotrichum scovillei TaxID=1209932 RepID=A0A9P7R8W8_9PEZI|nr:biotin-requiring enzyme [Colletotrichum scovillei]KAF4782735.1 biotin-requiring enzyme [Colletotrichum scovillei]KAG7051428.1 pyruvate dehydrogenase e2 component (dihydrolipoamide acetyltransferase) [Colletotrichum scovillei]KAG7070465.1 pyruvate dehydrogenase e2 component (dihydrolipoamide acetyltransferase) [Colletotrichum scovillei]KAG7078682.1 pyruvate dehydrogenase e2 component (dihydrolipoamide acetyltransferase) [Colletotrichum scovillei]